ncbi:MAG: pyridoxamine 5'-phosphate oxidase family protein [Actinomycetota bacterium]|nr:pyridoxamine 5'-phosphate oxidase family protein [Actinomycetota bacterium]
MPFRDAITDVGQLRQRYRSPSALVQRKESPILDDGARQFIAASPLFVMCTAGSRGADASPRGGPPGFVAVLDDHRLAWADLSGNNRLDSCRNMLEQPTVALWFVVPGVGEQLRVNGTATVTVDPEVLDATVIDGRRAELAIGVDVAMCMIHCAKALRRSGTWDPDSWLPADERPSAAAILKGHLAIDVDEADIEANLETAYRDTLWSPGGRSVATAD